MQVHLVPFLDSTENHELIPQFVLTDAEPNPRVTPIWPYINPT